MTTKRRWRYDINRTEQNRTEQNRTEQNRTEQNRTEQNRSEQNRSEQNRTEQNRTDQIRSGTLLTFSKFLTLLVVSLCAVVALPFFAYGETAEAEDVRRTIPKFYDIYCTEETAANLTSAIHALDEAVREGELDNETLSTLQQAVTVAVGQLQYRFDEKIPQVYIATDNGSGESYGIGLTKNIGDADSQITVVSTDGSIILSDMSWKSTIKVRGNSTSSGAKKPYNIKFPKKETPNLFGMGESRKWTLLADFYDPTLMRNKIGLDLGETLGLKATPGPQRVEVWVDGFYRGMYLLTEKIEADENRVNIKPKKGDFLVEMDDVSRTEEGNIYFKTSGGRYFRLREPDLNPLKDDESEVEAAITNAKAKMDNFESILAAGKWAQVLESIDLDSFVSYYILNEFMKTIDFGGLSVYFYFHDGKVYAGPAWDFDLSSGNGNSGYYGDWRVSPEGLYAASSHYYAYLFKFPEFQWAVFQKFLKVCNSSLEEIYKEDGQIDHEVMFYADAINRNNDVWSVGTVKTGLQRKSDSNYKANVDFLKTWLKDRHNWMKSYFLNRIYTESDGNRYYYANGQRSAAGIVEQDGEYYYAGEGGKIKTGLIETNGHSYYADETGRFLVQSLTLTLSGNESLTVDYGQEGAVSQKASVIGNYGYRLEKTLSSGYTLTWSSDVTQEGISFSDGTLNVDSRARPGTYEIRITAKVTKDNCVKSVEKTVEITVRDEAPALPAVSDITVTEGAAMNSVTITATAGTNLQWSVDGLPAWMSTTSGDKTLTLGGTPTDGTGGMEYTIRVTAKNSMGTADTTFKVTVARAAITVSPREKAFTATAGASLTAVEQTFTAISAVGYTWSVSPAGTNDGVTATITNGTLKLSGTPTAVKTHIYTVTATTKSGAAATARVTLTVTPKPSDPTTSETSKPSTPEKSEVPEPTPEPTQEPVSNEESDTSANGTQEDTGYLSPSSSVLDAWSRSGRDTPNTLQPSNSNVGAERDASSLLDEERKAVSNDNSVVAAVLPEISVNVSGPYLLGVDIDEDVPTGATLSLHLFPRTTTNGEVALSEAENTGTFFDDEGNEITTVPENHHVNVAVELKAGVTYAPVITAVKDGVDSESQTSNHNSGGGCDAGLGFAGLLALTGLIAARKH